MKEMPPAGQFLPDWQAQLFEAQPAPVRHAFIWVHGPLKAPQDSGGKRHRSVSDDHASEHAAARTERSLALHLDAPRAQVDHVDRAPRTERGLRHAQDVPRQPRFCPPVDQGVIHCPVPG